jgi:hypothetical protein
MVGKTVAKKTSKYSDNAKKSQERNVEGIEITTQINMFIRFF